ncbi:MAG TPA: M14 family metallocarboxypeptidase [Chthoniobacterales bacterium]
MIERWRALAARWGWQLYAFAQESGQEIFVIESAFPAGPSLYLSAGIHGDEPASTEGLLAWAEGSAERLSRCAFTLFPCLNPWGLILNMRNDSQGRDLNRSYNDPECQQTLRQLAWIADRSYDAAFMLHEDYDGTGYYLYEITPGESWGGQLVAAAAPFVGVEGRPDIEGVPHSGGVVTRELAPDLLELMPKHPEALFLAVNGTTRCYTLETPSESAIDCRVDAHVAVLNRALDLLGAA